MAQTMIATAGLMVVILIAEGRSSVLVGHAVILAYVVIKQVSKVVQLAKLVMAVLRLVRI